MTFPAWFAGQVLTATRMNARNVQLITQDNELTITSSTTLQDTEIVVPVEAGAIYLYWCYISYSAHTTPDFKWAWSAPSGCLLASFTQAYVEGAGSGANTGAAIIMRRPGNTTERIAGGTDTVSPPVNFHSAYDRGTIWAAGDGGDVVLRVAQNTSSANQTILHGGNQTRMLVARVQ